MKNSHLMFINVVFDKEEETCYVFDDLHRKDYDKIRTAGDIGTAVKDFVIEKGVEKA